MDDKLQSVGEVVQELRPELLQSYAKLREHYESHPAALKLLEDHPGRKAAPSDLIQYIKQRTNCAQCPGLESCPNEFHGHRPHMVDHPQDAERICLTFRPCGKLQAAERQQKIARLIKSHNVPAKVLEMSFDKLEPTPERKEAIKRLIAFCVDFRHGETSRGIYLHGPLGVGKSALAAATARELAERDVDVLMVYVPDFVEEIKNAIGEKQVGAKLDTLRNVSVLILDDIGAEQISVWIRDSVLSPILNWRMDRVPTIYTSNLTISELRTHFLQITNKDPEGLQKTERLMERIEHWVDPVYVGGANRRRKS